MDRSIGAVLILIGLVVAAVGAAVTTGLLGWFGRLPGDIRIEREGLSIFVPITSMLILSVAFSAGVWIWRRFL